MTDKEVMQSAMNEHCPACGYYCLGNGGVYCIDKPTTVETTRACLAQPEQYDQTELELCKKCGWKAVWPDGCLVCEKQKAQLKHWSDCAVHSEPAYPAGECDCGGVQPEPVVWHEPGAYGNVTIYEKWAKENGWLPLYTTPQKKEWVGLTDEDISGCINSTASLVKGQFLVEFSKSIEAKLKEKNNAD